MADQFKILSIDGGGIRGIIPAMILTEIEKRTGKRIAEMFNLIAGTSTGGILALGLTKPGSDNLPAYTAEELVELYDKEGPRIFSRSVWHRIRAIGNAVEEKYPAEEIEAILDDYFGDAVLSQAVADVLVTSYEIEQRRPFFFKSHKAKKNPEEFDFLMKDAARATSAAPTYFEPSTIDISGPLERLALIDGGVYANNPAACAMVEAIRKFGKRPDEVYMLSLGTGELTRPIRYEDAKGWGLIQWAQPLLNVVFDGVSDTVDYQVDLILNGADSGEKRYHRLQLKLDQGNDDMDDASSTNRWALKLLATDLIEKHSDLINEICDTLTQGELLA